MSRFTEVLCESLPQASLQAFVYLQTPDPTWLQRVSLLGSVAAAGYIMAMARQAYALRKTFIAAVVADSH